MLHHRVHFLESITITIMRLIFLSLLFVSQVTLSNEIPPISACSVNSPRVVQSQLSEFKSDNPQQVFVKADSAQINYPNKALFNGNVNFRQGDTLIKADRAKYSEVDNIFSATGNLFYQDERLTLKSNSLSTSLDGKNTELLDTQYWLNGMAVHGLAKSFTVEDGRFLILSDALFTTCPGETPDWSLNAKEIRIDSEKDWATVRQATLEIFEVPVFYFPYLTLPVSDKRSSGFLYPTIGSNSNNGLEVSTPYYWNISPQYDLTFTPRTMTERGIQLANEFRYLVDKQQGQFNLEYLHSDRAYDNEARYLFYWNHGGSINENWRVSSDFTHVSDDNYFVDIGSDLANKTDNQLIKNIELSYYQTDWWLNFKVQDIQVLGETTSAYRLLPQISLHSYQNTINQYFEYDLYSEFSAFENPDDSFDKANRLHIEPTLRMPLNYSSGSLTGEVSLMQTWYQQSDQQQQNQDISRSLAQFRLHGILNLERDFSQEMVQTLEPQIQYLKVPYEKQSHINLYDTALLRDDYHGLFRARRFSGLDRIADTDQITFGMTTRLKNHGNQELLKLSIGQTFYFRDSKMSLLEGESSTELKSRSALAGELDFTFNERWYVSQAIQLNQNQSQVTQSKSSIDYRYSDNKIVQLSHRYVKEINDGKINQLGIQTIWPINHEWTFVGNYYRDINLNRTIESFVGLQYESCCWAIRVEAYRQLQAQYSEDLSQTAQQSFDTGINFNFQIRGLGASGKQQAQDMLNQGLFSYRRPYYLKN